MNNVRLEVLQREAPRARRELAALLPWFVWGVLLGALPVLSAWAHHLASH